MSEYEGVTFSALVALAEEFAKIADATKYLADLRELHEAELLNGRVNGAACLDHLIKSIAQCSKGGAGDV
jgi:hypothetical protein